MASPCLCSLFLSFNLYLIYFLFFSIYISTQFPFWYLAAEDGVVGGPGLPPHPVVGAGEGVAVRVRVGQDIPIIANLSDEP